MKIRNVVLAALAVIGLGAAAHADVLINEIRRWERNYYPAVEFWNSGSAQEMTGWRVVLRNSSNGSPQTYDFPDGFTIGADQRVLLQYYYGTDSPVDLFIGTSYNSFYDFSLTLLDADSVCVDYVKTSGSNDTPPAGAWTGSGHNYGSNYVVYRWRIADSNSSSDWADSSTATILAPNPGQEDHCRRDAMYAGPVINAVSRYGTDYVELWNRGDSLDMAGWSLVMGGSQTYTFPAGFTAGPGRVVTVRTGSGTDDDSTLYIGRSFTMMYDVSLLDAAGSGVDYVSSYFSGDVPVGTFWYGEAAQNGTYGFERIRNEDTDTRFDWQEQYDDTTRGIINRGQSHSPFISTGAAGFGVTLDGAVTVVRSFPVGNIGAGTLNYKVTADLHNGSASGMVPGWNWLVTDSGHGNRPFADGFEDGTYDAWTVDDGTYSRTVTSATAASGTYSFLLDGGNDDYYDGISLQFPEGRSPEAVRFSIRAALDYRDSGYFVMPYIFGFRLDSDHYMYLNGASLRRYYDDTWYDVRLELDWDAHAIDVYVDGVLRAEDVAFYNDFSRGTSLQLYNRDDNGVWFDDISMEGNCSGSLASGAAAQVPLTFDRTGEAAGTYYATLNVENNARNAPSPLAVPCTLVVPAVAGIGVPDSAAFGSVLALGTDTVYAVLRNTGSIALAVDSVSSSDPAFRAGAALPFTIALGDTVTVPLLFNPSSAGAHAGDLSVHSGAGTSVVACTGTGVDGPALSLDVTEIGAAVDSGDTAARPFTISNAGVGSLVVAVRYDDHQLVINEIYVNSYVEFRNRGPAMSLAGWKLRWTYKTSVPGTQYTSTFVMPDTAYIDSCGLYGYCDYSYHATSNIVYMERYFNGYMTSVALLDTSDRVIDYFRRDIYTGDDPDGAHWVGKPCSLYNNDYVAYRHGDVDTDSRDDWFYTDQDGDTKGYLNPGQNAEYRNTWLQGIPAIDTVLAAGRSLAVQAVLDARNAYDGYYANPLYFENNGPEPVVELPVAMNVGPQRYLAVPDKHLIFPNTYPYGVSHDTLFLYNPGTDSVRVHDAGYNSGTSGTFRCHMETPFFVPAGETLGVPYSYNPSSYMYTYANYAYLLSDAVNSPSVRLYFKGTPEKIAPEIVSVPVMSAVEDAPYAYQAVVSDEEPRDTVFEYSLITAPDGMVIDTTAGLITWTPGNDDNGWNPVTVRVSDGRLYGDQSFSVYVEPVNMVPAVTPIIRDTAYTRIEYIAGIVAEDEDAEELTYLLDSAPDGMRLTPAGVFIWTPDTLFRDSTVTVAYRVSDGDASAADTFGLHVRDLRLLRLGADTVVCAAEVLGSGVGYNSFMLYNDGRHSTAVSAVTFSDPAFSLYNAPPFSVYQGGYANRYIRFRPTVMGTVYATVTVYSDAMDHPVLQFAVVGEGLNTAPRITSTPGTAATEDAPYAYRITAEDDEIDTTLVCSLLTAPAGMAVDDTGLATWTPVDAQYGDNPVALIVSDGFLADTQSFVISVARVNDPPVLAYEPVYDTAYYGVPYSYLIPVTDEEGDSLLYALTSPPTGMRVTDAGEIVWLAPISAVGTWTPVVYSVSDGDSVVSSSYMLYTANEQRLLAASADTIAFPHTPVGSASQCTLFLVNSGTANTDVTTLQVTNGAFTPSRSAPFTVAAGGTEAVVLTYAPTLPQEDNGTVTILSDAVDRPNITVALRASSVRHAPYFTSTPDTTAVEDSAYAYQAVAVDADPGDTLRYGLEGHPQGLVIDPVTGLVTWMPENDDAGDWTVIIRVTDGHFNVDQEYVLHVQPVNDPPVITSGPAVDTTRERDNYILFTVAEDEEDDSLRFGFVDSLPGMTIDGTGMIHWDVPDGYGGFTYPVTYTVSDGEHTVQASYDLYVRDASGIGPVDVPGTGVRVALGANPTGAAVRFVLLLERTACVRCEVYALDGRPVFASAGTFGAGAAEMRWAVGSAAGLHHYVITAGDAVVVGTVMVLR